jgi:hypothetical protein
MAKKENKGGFLSPEQVEQDNKVKGKTSQHEGGYRGSQDTGDTGVRELGTEVQRQDGIGEDEQA